MTDQPIDPAELGARIKALQRARREFDQARRDERLRHGRAKPKTLREFEIFGEYLRREPAASDSDAHE